MTLEKNNEDRLRGGSIGAAQINSNQHTGSLCVHESDTKMNLTHALVSPGDGQIDSTCWKTQLKEAN